MKNLTLFFLLLLSFYGNSQNNLTLKKNKIHKVCTSYINESTQFYTTDYDFDNLDEVCTPPLKKYYIKLNEYAQVAKIPLEKKELEFTITVIEVKDSLSCLVNKENEKNITINVSKYNNHWLVDGFNNHVYTQTEINESIKYLDSMITKIKITKEIKPFIDTVIVEYNNYFLKNGSTKLKLLCTPLAFEQLALDRYLNKSNKKDDFYYTPFNYKENYQIKYVSVLSDSTLKVSIINSSYNRSGTYIYFVKKNDKWLFSGEKNIATIKSINRKKRKTTQHKQTVYYSNLMNEFKPKIESFFKKTNDNLFKQVTSDGVFKLFTKIRWKMSNYDPSFVHINNFEFDHYSNIRVKNDTLHINSLIFKIETDSSLKLVSFRYKNNTDLSDAFLADNYVNILKQLNFEYSDSDIEVLEELISREEIQLRVKNDTTIYSMLDSHIIEAKFVNGGEELYKFIKNHKKIKTKSNTYVYIQFTIEKDGSINNVIALNKVNQKLATDAINIINEMPNWLPATHKYQKNSMRYKYVLPILY